MMRTLLPYVARFVPALASLLASLVFASQLKIDDFALYSLVVAWIPVFNSILFSWNTLSFARNVHANLYIADAFRQSTIILWAQSAILSVALLLLAVSLFDLARKTVLFIAFCSLLSQSLYELHIEFLRSALRQVEYVIVTTLYGLLFLSAGTLLAVITHEMVSPFLAITTAHVAAILTAHWMSRGVWHWRRTGPRPAVLDPGYAVPLAVAALISSAMPALDRALIAAFSELGNVATYSLAHTVLFSAFSLVGSVVSLFIFPAAMRSHETGDSELVDRLLRRQGNILVLVMSPGLGVLVSNVSWVKRLPLTGYDELSSIIPMICIAAAANAARSSYFDTLHHLGRATTRITSSLVIGLIFLVAGIAIWVPDHGVVGAAWAVLLGYSMAAVVSIATGLIRRRAAWPARSVVALAAIAVLAQCFLGFGSGDGLPVGAGLLLGSLQVVVYFLVLFLGARLLSIDLRATVKP